MSTRMSATLRAALVQAGKLDDDGYARKAKARRCRCGAVVLRGLDADRCGWPVDVDPAPLTGLGEAAMRIIGRATYELHIVSDRIEIDYRDRYRIKARPADSPDNDVVAEHQCGTPPILTKPQPEPEKGADNDEPPY